MEDQTEEQLADLLHDLVERFADPGALRRLRLRVAELGPDARDEVAQFRLLQRACRESPDLGRALASSGFGIVATLDSRTVGPATGKLVQAFNRMVEKRWRPPP